MIHNSMYYNWREIDGYNAPITVVVGSRGLGKTFSVVKNKGIGDFIKHGKRFIYVVETDEMVKELASNRGEKFFASIIEFCENNPSHANTNMLKVLVGDKDKETTIGDDDEDTFVDEDNHKIVGSVIKIDGETAGYLLSISGYARVKRNNFVNVGHIIIDEFIPEEIDVRSLKTSYKVVSIIQSIARTSKNIKIYMMGNSIRSNDNLLVKLGLANMKPGEIRKIKDKYGLLVVGHMINKDDYTKFKKVSDESVAGRLAKLLGEDSLDKNEFRNGVPENLTIPSTPKSSYLFFCLHGEGNISLRVNLTKDHLNYYILEDYGVNTRNRVCLDPKFQSPVVNYIPEYKELLLEKYNSGSMLFENDVVYAQFKILLKLE